jgi:hypothetical protein
MMIKKFESFSDDFKNDLREYLIEVYDDFDTEIEIWTKEEFLATDEVMRGNINGHQNRYLKNSNFVVKTRIKPNPYTISGGNGGNQEYSLEGAIESAKHNYDILTVIKNGLESLNVDYKFYIRETYQCFFFINETPI